jgi:hypothetical protein
MKSGEDAVAALLDILNREGLPYMIVGSFSSNRYGVPRATHDADFVVGTKGIAWTKYLAELPEGFELDPQASFEMVTATQRRIIEIPSLPFTIELFELSSDEHDQLRFSRRKKLTLLGREAWLPTAEDVIIQKLRWSRGAKRPKDFADVVAVMQVQGPARLDWPYIEEWCGKHGTLDLLEEAKAEAAHAWEEE